MANYLTGEGGRGGEKSADPRSEWNAISLALPWGIWLSHLPAPPALASTTNCHGENLDTVGHVFLSSVLGAWDAECACLNDSACLRLNFSDVQVL